MIGRIAGVLLILFSSGALLAVGLAVLPLSRWLFGCVSWLLAIFEAVVAVPIMLVAHLRTDGEGLAGPMAQTGYTILLSLFLRPILMVFSLVIGLLIFNNVVPLLNLLFLPNMQASAASGNTMGFFIGVAYVVAYCTTVYGLANASFKSIDLLPNQILRWIGGVVMQDVDNSGAMERGVQRTGDAAGSSYKDAMKGAAGDEPGRPGRGAAGGTGSGPGMPEISVSTEQMIPHPGDLH